MENLSNPEIWNDGQILARLREDFQNVFIVYLTSMPNAEDAEAVTSYWEFVDKHPVKTFENYVKEEGLKYETRILIRPSERVKKNIETVNRYLLSAERARKYHDLDGLKRNLEQLRAFIASACSAT